MAFRVLKSSFLQGLALQSLLLRLQLLLMRMKQAGSPIWEREPHSGQQQAIPETAAFPVTDVLRTLTLTLLWPLAGVSAISSRARSVCS